MTEKNRIAIIGATGEVGAALLAALEEADFPEMEVKAVASESSEDETVLFKGRALFVEPLESFDFKKVDIALFAVPAAVSLKFIAKARAAGCKVIDHSTAFTLDESVALLCQAKAVPSTDFLAVASPLSALLATVFQSVAAVTPIQSAEATVLQPVSSKGRQGVRELAGQTGELLNARGITPNVFPAQTAFNVLPLVGEMSGNQLMDELERVLPSPIPVVLSEAIVPVFYGMTVSLVVHTERDIDQDAIQSALISAGFLIEKDDENHELATPVGSASNTAGVVMSGLSALPAPLNGFRVWLLTDNIRQVVVNLTIKAVEKWIKRL